MRNEKPDPVSIKISMAIPTTVAFMSRFLEGQIKEADKISEILRDAVSFLLAYDSRSF